MSVIVRRLVLFDIDGTLLWTNGAGRRAIRSPAPRHPSPHPSALHRRSGGSQDETAGSVMSVVGSPADREGGGWMARRSALSKGTAS